MTKRKLLTADQFGITDVLDVVQNVYQMEVDIRGDEAYFLCPAHEDHKPSASVNLKTGYWACWSCSTSGDIIHLGTKVLKMSRMLVETSLSPSDPDSKRLAAVRSLEALKRNRTVQEKDVVVDRIQDPSEFDDEPLTYMRARGFRNRTLRKFGIKFVDSTRVRTKNDKTITIENSIAIPLHDSEGELAGWCFRATPSSPGWQPRYFYTAGSKISDLLFAEHLLVDNAVVLTEGAIDAMWIMQAGFQATAVLGASNANVAKADRLSDFRKVVIFGDRNAAGIKFVERMGMLLSSHTSVRVCRYRRSWQGNDPNELTAEQVSAAILRAVPFHEWRLGT